MIDCSVYGDATQCRAAAVELLRQGGDLAQAEGEVSYALMTAERVWRGEAARGFYQFAAGMLDEATELRAESLSFSQELDRFADAIDGVRHAMSEACALAQSQGLLVTDNQIHEAGASPPAYLVTAGSSFVPPQGPYERCRDLVAAARAHEENAHRSLQEATARVRRADFLQHWLTKAGLLPTSSSAGGFALFAGGAGLLSLGVAADWATRVRYGSLLPRVGGEFLTVSELGFRDTLRYGVRSANWRAFPGGATPYARWATTGQVLGVVGAGVTAGASAWSQWRADADDPTISDTEQVARAATVGLAAGGGAYVGAVGGAQLGAALGTAICPVGGTVVGGAVGGIVGGLIGSGAGEWLGGEAKGVVGEAADAIGGLVSKGKFW